MANENVTTQNTDTTVTENKQTTTTPQADNSAPSVEELMAQLATERAENEKNKLALDKALKEKGDITKQLRARQTAEEQEAEAQKEAQRLADEERESMRKELNHIKAVNAYKSIPDEKVVENLIDAISDADHNTIAQIIENEKKKAVAEAEQQWMKDRPRVNHGQHSTMSREDIMAIKDSYERQSMIAQNIELFRK